LMRFIINCFHLKHFLLFILGIDTTYKGSNSF